MKTIAERFLNVRTGIIIFFAGLLCLFLPHISGWSDIVFPSLALVTLLPYFFWETLFVAVLVLLLVCVLLSFILKASRRTKNVFVSFPLVLILIFLMMYPNFATEENLGINQRVSFFAIGGRTLIVWAGGLERVKDDALSLFTQPTDDEGYVEQDVWPKSLKRLRPYEIEINRERRCVLIYIPNPRLFDADHFGFLITEGEELDPGVFRSGGYRFWKLDEGVYFFELW